MTTGQRALHPGQHDDGVGRGHPVDVGQQPVQPGDADVVEAVRREAVGGERERALVGHRAVGRSRRDDQHPAGAVRGGLAVEDVAALDPTGAVLGGDGFELVVVGPGQQDGPGAVGEQLADDAHALLGRLARPVHGLGHALAQRPVVVDEGVAEVGERQPGEGGDDVVGGAPPGLQVGQHRPQGRLVHAAMLPPKSRGDCVPTPQAAGRAGAHSVGAAGIDGDESDAAGT